MKKLEVITAAVISEFTRLEKAIGRYIQNYLHISAKVYVSRTDGTFLNAAWASMSRDNSYVKNYIGKIDFTVYREDEEKTAMFFISKMRLLFTA